jgi:hypothetical protein
MPAELSKRGSDLCPLKLSKRGSDLCPLKLSKREAAEPFDVRCRAPGR